MKPIRLPMMPRASKPALMALLVFTTGSLLGVEARRTGYGMRGWQTLCRLPHQAFRVRFGSLDLSWI